MDIRRISFIEAGSPGLHIFSKFPIPRLGAVLLSTINGTSRTFSRFPIPYPFIAVDVMVEIQTRSEFSMNDQSGSAISSMSGVHAEAHLPGRSANRDLTGNGVFLLMEIYFQASGKIGLPLRRDRDLWKNSRC